MSGLTLFMRVCAFILLSLYRFVLPDNYTPAEVTSYQTAIESSWAWSELHEVRNCHASFHWGFLPGMIYTALSAFLFKGKEPWTISNNDPDSAKTGVAANYKPINYPKPDGVLSFDLLTNLSFSGTDHNDQPSHLRIKPELAEVPQAVSLQVFAGPEQRFCPAKVYAYDEKGNLEINAQNCLHCKACSIKMPSEYIDWTVPEGGGGPKYVMYDVMPLTVLCVDLTVAFVATMQARTHAVRFAPSPRNKTVLCLLTRAT